VPEHADVETVAADLGSARDRTLALTDVEDRELVRQHSPLMSPLVWDLAHVGQQEDLWLLRQGDPRRQGVLPARVDKLYDAFEHPRAQRPSLPLLPPAQARSFLGDVRAKVLDRLGRLDRLGTSRSEQAEELFTYAMVVQHEDQHSETMLATHQLREGPPVLAAEAALPPGRAVPQDAVLVPAGEFLLGVDAVAEPTSLDNERPAHIVDLPAFRLDRLPVTNAQWQRFIGDGGYAEPRWWSTRGWRHRVETGLERPLFWSPDGSRRRFGTVEDIPPDEPVQHVCFFEAEAYAAWAGGRLPTEAEWEKACCWDPVEGRRRRWPWGSTAHTPALANLGGAALRPAPVGAYPAGASAYGVEQLIGDVWEWTTSGFEPWPGFVPMIYDSYSAPFFGGDFRVLRGGSWATAPTAVRPSFRNWDLPVRRQIFTGLRLAWDA
jgi:iron(II)-dependent oxidoreductase